MSTSRELTLARLIAMRATIDAWILEATESEVTETEGRCCKAPKLHIEETYSGKQARCLNCEAFWVITAGPDKVSGDLFNQTKQEGD